jgi:lambda family phage portal protein
MTRLNILGRALHTLGVIDRHGYANFLPKPGGGTGRKRSGYTGAAHDRLTADWFTDNLSSDKILRWHLSKLRARSRDLSRNNDYVKKFITLLKTNVIGPFGIRLQSKVKGPDGKPDRVTNQLIEEMWKQWGQKKNCTVTTTLTWRQVQNLILRTVAIDGEMIIRKVRGFENDFRLAVQLIDPDRLDIQLNKRLPNGNEIILGIEFDAWKRPINYYFIKNQDGSYIDRHDIIPASEIIHVFIKDDVSQKRGVPWLHTAIIGLKMLGSYTETELIAARVGAAKMGFFTSSNSNEYLGDDEDEDGNLISEAEPGAFEQLPPGVDVKEFDPKHPNGNHYQFNKAVLRGLSAGMGVSYNSLANDLEGVNFSSVRQGVLEEREVYKTIQQWFIDEVNDELFPDVLQFSILSGQLKLPINRLNEINAPLWQPRGYTWVDPLKDTKANVEANNHYLTSPQQILREKGTDLDTIIEDHAEFYQLLKQNGLPVPNQTQTTITDDDIKEDEEDAKSNN